MKDAIFFESYVPDSSDYERVGDKLTEFSRQVAGPRDWNEVGFAFQAAVENKPVGDIIGNYNTPWGLCHISLLYIDPRFRKKGVGTRLMSLAEDFAKAKGCTVMTVETPSWQAPLFYPRLGFRETGRTPLPSVLIDGMPQHHLKFDKLIA